MNSDPDGARGRLHLRKCGFNRTSDLQRVGTVLARNHKNRAGRALDGGGANHGLWTLGDRGHIFQPHTPAVLVPHDNVTQLFWRKLLSFGSKYDALIRGIHETCPSNTRCSSGRLQHFINGSAELQQPVRTDLNLKLANLSAKDDNLCDTGHSQQTWSQRPVGKGSNFHQGSGIRCKTQLKHIAGRRSQWRHRRRPNTLRDTRSHFD